jgi:hypothetical protein
VLRAPSDFRDEARREFFQDMSKVAEYIGGQGSLESTRAATSSLGGSARRSKNTTPRRTRTRTG